MQIPTRIALSLTTLIAFWITPCYGQATNDTNRPPRFTLPGPRVVSPEVSSDRQITFRLMATNAQKVRLNAGDIPGNGSKEMTKDGNGIWEVAVGPIDPGAYRYNFNVDGVSVIDPKNPATSE